MNSLNKVLLAVGLAAAAAVTVQAQDGATTTSTPRPIAAADMVTNVQSFQTQIDADAKRMQHLQNIARKAKDVVKLTCVNDKIVELKAEQNVFDVNKKTFDAAIQSNPDSARASYSDLATSAETISTVRGAAEACIGVPELYKQESDVEVSHPDFPDDPTVDDPFGPGVEPPAYASPY